MRLPVGKRRCYGYGRGRTKGSYECAQGLSIFEGALKSVALPTDTQSRKSRLGRSRPRIFTAGKGKGEHHAQNEHRSRGSECCGNLELPSGGAPDTHAG